jgi:hypothetical protein
MHGLAALCHTVRKGGYIGSRSTYTWRASSLLDKNPFVSIRGPFSLLGILYNTLLRYDERRVSRPPTGRFANHHA